MSGVRAERELIRRIENLRRSLAAANPRTDDRDALLKSIERLTLELFALRKRLGRRGRRNGPSKPSAPSRRAGGRGSRTPGDMD